MSAISPKRQLMIAKQHLDKLAIFAINLTNFYRGLHPDLDAEFAVLRKHLSGKPDYDAANEITSKVNADLKKDTKFFQQRNLDSVNHLEKALKNLSSLDSIDDETKHEALSFIETLGADKGAANAPLEEFEKALIIYNKALSHHKASKTSVGVDSPELIALFNNITQELKELIAPFYANNRSDKTLREVYQKLNAGLGNQELLECCLILIRFVIRDVIKDATNTSKLINDLHKSIVKINQGLKTTIMSSQTRSKKRKAHNQSMQAQITAMEMVLSESDELVDLKRQAKIHLAKMQASISATEKQEHAEQIQLITLMQKMQERMALLEEKAEAYKRKLFTQRANALTDVLTKLPNRMAYEDKVAIEVANFKANVTPLTLAIMDIDLFKQINDKYGHSVGDKTLQVIANNIRKTFDNKVFVARWGGEEFVCLFPGIVLEEAFSMLEEVRIKIAKLPFMFKGQRVSVTISSGVAEFSQKTNAESVFDTADKRLYQAKSSGRNQTVMSTAEDS